MKSKHHYIQKFLTMVWSIVLVKVYFTDLSEYKVRPVYVFKKYDDEDYMFLPLSSNINRNGILIDKSSLKSWSLDRDSIVIIPKIWIIHNTLIIKKIWILTSRKILEIQKQLCDDLWCSN